MRLFILAILGVTIGTSMVLNAAEGGCKRCQVIREENKKKVNDYEYYEDYVKDNPEEKQTTNREPQQEKQSGTLLQENPIR